MKRFTSLVLIGALGAGAACAGNKDPGATANAGSTIGPNGDPDASFPPQPPPSTDIPIPDDCQSPGFPGGDRHGDFAALRAKLVALKPVVEARQAALLDARYDLTPRPSSTVRMSRGKPVQTGVRVKLPPGQTWDSLGATSPDQIRQADAFPAGFFPLPHPNHPLGASSSHAA